MIRSKVAGRAEQSDKLGIRHMQVDPLERDKAAE
jgi:hypothetical protein